MKEKAPVSVMNLSKRKELVFKIILALLPFFFLLIIELILRVSGYGDKMSMFINHPDEAYKEYKVMNPEIGKKYFQQFEYSKPPKDIFLKKKPEDVFRIFVMGSSSVAGFPYDNNLMFSRILNERLRDAYPDKKIEVVNTAITAINSFTLLDFMPQILRESPDAILIYAGHNEFYGAFGVGSNEALTHNPALIRLHLKMMNLRIYQLTKNGISKTVSLFRKDDTALQKRGTLMTRIVKDADILFGSKSYKEGIKNYEQNMGIMLSMAQTKHVDVFISDLVSNIRDIKPLKSVSSANMKSAEEYFNEARAFEAKNDFISAKKYYELARDYDCVRFRASSDINKTIKDLASKYKAHFVPTLELYNANSKDGIVGDNLMTEHLHPNIPGQFLLAESFYKEMVASKLIANKVNVQTEKRFKTFMKSYGYSYLDFLVAKHRITNLKYHWPFVDETNGFVDYRQIYKPDGYIDSMAFAIMATKTITHTDAHLKLAEMYERKGDLINAFTEYNALSMINPYFDVYFRKAADCLLKTNDLPGALRLFERSLQYGKDSFYAHFRSGEICLMKNDLERALIHFEEAMKSATSEEKNRLLIKIYQTNINLNRPEEAQKALDEFRKSFPNQTIQIPLKGNYLMDYVPIQIENEVIAAKKNISEEKIQEAIDVLIKSLEIKESSVTYRLLGDLMYPRGDYQNANFFFEKAYPDFAFDSQFLHHYIVSSLSVKKVEEAKTALNQLKKIDPKYSDIPKLEGFVNKFASN